MPPLASTGGNKLAASMLLKISHNKLYAKIAKYRL
jgi:DNA-binding NtrC family response regulator